MTLKDNNIIRLTFIMVALLFLLLSTPLFGISSEKLMLMSLGFVATVGLSHGSLDWVLARHWGIRRNFIESLVFMVFYVVIVLLTLEIWRWLPAIALGIFLLMSMIHFANDWKNELNYAALLIMGIAVVAQPGIMHEKDVLGLFELLVSAPQAVMLSQYLYIAGWIGMLGASWIAYQQIKISPLLSTEIVSLMIAAILLPPIIYFSIYFCVLHTTKHWLQMKRIGLYKNFSQAIWSAAWPTLACIIAGIWICHASTQWSFSQSLIRTIFIGLAALTVPHWLLLEIYPIFRARKSAQ